MPHLERRFITPDIMPEVGAEKRGAFRLISVSLGLPVASCKMCPAVFGLDEACHTLDASLPVAMYRIYDQRIASEFYIIDSYQK